MALRQAQGTEERTVELPCSEQAKRVELRKIGVRGALPLCLKWSEYVAMILVFLDRQPEELTNGLRGFYFLLLLNSCNFSRSPFISASFFARDQRFSWASRFIASEREANFS